MYTNSLEADRINAQLNTINFERSVLIKTLELNSPNLEFTVMDHIFKLNVQNKNYNQCPLIQLSQQQSCV